MEQAVRLLVTIGELLLNEGVYGQHVRFNGVANAGVFPQQDCLVFQALSYYQTELVAEVNVFDVGRVTGTLDGDLEVSSERIILQNPFGTRHADHVVLSCSAYRDFEVGIDLFLL